MIGLVQSGAFQLPRDVIFDGFVREMMTEIEPVCQLPEDPPARFCVEARFDGLLTQGKGRFRTATLDDIVRALEKCRFWQDEIAHPRSLVEAVVNCDNQVESVKATFELGGVGQCGEWIVMDELIAREIVDPDDMAMMKV
jgi:hypothetical protein